MHSEKTFEGRRQPESHKRRLVEEGRAHAALVYDGDEAVAWCEYGSPEEQVADAPSRSRRVR
jgi:hypothetical protein